MSIRRIALRQQPEQDAGNTLIVAVMVAFLVMALGLVVIGQAVTTTQNSGKDRQRTAQVHTAEAGIDRIYYLLQTGSTPCPGVETTFNSHGAPDETSVRADVRYFDAAGSPTDPCDTGAQRAARAIITATATSANAVGPGSATQRTMESEVLLSPMTGGDGYAIFTESTLEVGNTFQLTAPGEAADIFVRGSGGEPGDGVFEFECRENSYTSGNVVVQGDASLEQCELSNTLHVVGDILLEQTQIGGNIISSAGGVVARGPQTSVAKDVRVAASATFRNGAGTSAVRGGIYENLGEAGSQNPHPSEQQLPYIGLNTADWADFTFVTPTACTEVPELIEEATSNLLIQAPACEINVGDLIPASDKELTLQHDVAIFLGGDFTLSTGYKVVSSDGSRKRLWLISPAGSSPSAPPEWSSESCDGHDITVETGGAEFAAPVEVFLYTCGTIASSQDNEMKGQIYGGNVLITQPMEMTFVSMPPPGVNLGGDDIMGYQIGVVYKRETANHLALTP